MLQFDRATRAHQTKSSPAKPAPDTTATLTSRQPHSAPIQHSKLESPAGPRFHFDFGARNVDVGEAARLGTSQPGGTLPHLDAIQRSFGRHQVSDTRAHTDSTAAEASLAMGARGFATGGHVAFAGAPSLHTAAHEAAHVVQQRSGLQLDGGVGRAGDRHERHADAVAERVTQGKSSERLLDSYGGAARSAGAGAVQHSTVVQRDEIRDAKSKNDTWMGDEKGPIALPGTKFTSDPYDHTVTIVHPDGTAKQYTYQIVQTDSGPREKLSHSEPLSPLRVKALDRMNQAGAGESQEDAGGPGRRKAADHKKGEEDRTDWRKADAGNPALETAYLAAMKAYQEMLDARTPAEKKKPPPPPPPAPAGYPMDKATTLCTAWPGEVYHSAGGDASQSFDFTPPKTLPGWHDFVPPEPRPKKQPMKKAAAPTEPKPAEKPAPVVDTAETRLLKPGDIYYLWDLTKNRAAHMGVFKSLTTVPGHPNIQRWVVTDGGQGTYAGIQQVNERSRTFNTRTGIFSSDVAEAGQDKGDRLLVGWIDIDEQNAAPKPPPKPKKPVPPAK